MATFTESIVEDATLAWLESLGSSVRHVLEIAPDTGNHDRNRDILSRTRGVWEGWLLNCHWSQGERMAVNY